MLIDKLPKYGSKNSRRREDHSIGEETVKLRLVDPNYVPMSEIVNQTDVAMECEQDHSNALDRLIVSVEMHTEIIKQLTARIRKD